MVKIFAKYLQKEINFSSVAGLSYDKVSNCTKKGTSAQVLFNICIDDIAFQLFCIDGILMGASHLLILNYGTEMKLKLLSSLLTYLLYYLHSYLLNYLLTHLLYRSRSLYFTAPDPCLFPGLALALNLYLTTLAPNLYLPALALTLY